jgi:hypothetical protein
MGAILSLLVVDLECCETKKKKSEPPRSSVGSLAGWAGARSARQARFFPFPFFLLSTFFFCRSTFFLLPSISFLLRYVFCNKRCQRLCKSSLLFQAASLSVDQFLDAVVKATTQIFHLQVCVNVFADHLEPCSVLGSRFLPRLCWQSPS